MLSKLELLEVYDSAEYDLVQDLQIPLLSSSVSYLRGVGYFTSGWMRLASQGLKCHIENGGRARIIVSPILEQQDWEALQTGHAATFEISLYRSLEKSIEELALYLERDTLNALAWMVADNLVEFRFAVERNRGSGDYHDKVAVFDDTEGNSVAIHGSFNDSIKATMNGEAFSVFRSWISGQEPFVRQHKRRLEELWNGGNSQFETFQIPDAAREKLIKLQHTFEAPYISNNATRRSISNHNTKLPPVQLRDYQNNAIDKWRDAGYRGIFEMATGTGKTVTALSAAIACVTEKGARLVVIIVPYLHLMEQWGVDARKYGFQPLFCSGENPEWPRELRSLIIDSSLQGAKPVCVIAVHLTAATERFISCISRANGEKLLLIADEVHGLGASHLRKALFVAANFRLGLSATPNRWFDEDGTDFLMQYFGGVCYELALESVIGTVLTPYYYYPQIINLEQDEHEEYVSLSKTIATLLSVKKKKIDEQLKHLLLRRARLISSAKNKLPALVTLVQDQFTLAASDGRDINGVLVYAPAGRHKEYLLALSNLGLRCHEFVHTVPLKRREEILHEFSSGQIQALVAVKCLDEGVDVPSTRVAYILSSSTNPREFVQRRGRILRRAAGKEKADVYDFLVMPSSNSGDAKDAGDLGLLRREMPRFAEFASAATNHFDARSVVRPLLDHYELLHLLDKRPWDVYKEMRQIDWEIENE